MNKTENGTMTENALDTNVLTILKGEDELSVGEIRDRILDKEITTHDVDGAVHRLAFAGDIGGAVGDPNVYWAY